MFLTTLFLISGIIMAVEIKPKPTLDDQTDTVMSEKVIDSTPEILAPFTNNILDVIRDSADIEINDNVKNFINETAYAESGSFPDPLTVRNKDTNAGGKFQFIESENNNSLTVGLNRLSAEKEDGSGYVYFDGELPQWVIEAQNHKDVTKLDNDQQTSLFLANLHQQKGTNSLFKKISEGDNKAKVDMYIKHHHKGKIKDGEVIYDPKVIKYAEDIFFGVAGDTKKT